MRRDNINYLAVGTFVIVMGVMLLVVLYQITGRTGPTDRYFVSYSNVAGISYGTAVYYEGYQLGQVESITPNRDQGGRYYRVEFSVSRGWEIPDDSVAKVVTSGLLSAVSIDISEGSSNTMLEPGSEIRGQDQVNLFAALNEVAADFGDLSKEGIKPMLRNLSDRITELSTEYTDLSASTVKPFLNSLRERLENEELWDELSSAINRLNGAAAQLQELLGDENQQHLSELLANTAEASVDLGARIEETRLKTNEFLDRMNKLMATNSGGVSSAVADAQVAAKELKESLQKVSDHIDAVMFHLESGSRHINEFARQIRENPGVLLRGTPQQEQ
jgi:phospholipid/cholesterol/gamma-HCH transport system substrate-binding protein